MVLVDTSIWIRFLRNQTPYVAELKRLLDLNEVAGHELIYGELLIGDHGGRTTLLNEYSRMDRVETIAHGEVVAFVRTRRLFSRGVGWIDIHLLASALVGRVTLWTADAGLFTLASELGIAYRVPQAHRKYVS
jgi:predicted nucleic acid-binding protein